MKKIVLITLVVVLSVLVIMADAYGAPNRSPQRNHDVAVTNMSAPSSCVQGDIASVVVSVANQGNYDESFDIKLTDVTDGKQIGTRTVSLASQSSAMDGVADLIFSGEEDGDQHYSSVTGDIDGDGHMDLIVGVHQKFNGKQGRVYLYYGGPDMDNKPDLIFNGEAGTTGRFGFTLGCGDIDNDGYDDIAVAASLYDNNNGRMYLFWGDKRENMDATADHIWDGSDKEVFGVSWNDRVMEDIDADGYADIIVTAMQGRAYLYWGNKKSSFDTTPDLVFDCPDKGGAWFGMGIACGDIDNDGYKDIVIGAMDYPNGSNYGRAYLYWGDTKSNMDAACDFIFDAESQDVHKFGGNVGIGDIDNDGCEDVVIGAYRYGNEQGRAYLYWGDTKANFDITPDLIFTGEHDNNLFGDLAICGGDVNNDGYGDILIGARIYDNQRGRAYLYLGDKRADMDAVADKVFTGENQRDWFSDPPGSCFGDFDNDGYDDVAIGAKHWPNALHRGRVYLYKGGRSEHSTDVNFDWDTDGASIGDHILKLEISPVAGEEDTADNTITAMVNVNAKVKQE